MDGVHIHHLDDSEQTKQQHNKNYSYDKTNDSIGSAVHMSFSSARPLLRCTPKRSSLPDCAVNTLTFPYTRIANDGARLYPQHLGMNRQ
jgi:hypothetical protein